MQRLLLFLVAGLALGQLEALEELAIPGARCLNGSPYKIFYRKTASSRYLIHLGGGGACWNERMATGLVRLCRNKAEPPLMEGVFDFTDSSSPFRDYNDIFYPYCTGDIFIGNHTKSYRGKDFFHEGAVNIQKATEVIFRHFKQHSPMKEVVVIGSSAGAVGVLFNFDSLTRFIPSSAKKTLVADSPGLHFGTQIWNEASHELVSDLARAFERNGESFSPRDETFASYVQSLCRRNPSWTIGVMQSSRDRVMSFMGRMTRVEHEELLRGESGIVKALEEASDSCSTWTPTTVQHKFLNAPNTLRMKTSDGVSAGMFLNQLLKGKSALQTSHD